MVERLNWMADRSEKGLHQSGGIMVNYVYRWLFIKPTLFSDRARFTKERMLPHTILMVWIRSNLQTPHVSISGVYHHSYLTNTFKFASNTTKMYTRLINSFKDWHINLSISCHIRYPCLYFLGSKVWQHFS